MRNADVYEVSINNVTIDRKLTSAAFFKSIHFADTALLIEAGKAKMKGNGEYRVPRPVSRKAHTRF